jgi:UDP-galactopyranose mutase
MKTVLVVGAGLSGSTFARRLAESISNISIFVIDKRNHVAGNCHTLKDENTGIIEHVYGPHIFHTSNRAVWDFINRFGEIVPFINRVKAITHNQVFSLPINLHTLNQFFKLQLNPSEAKLLIQSKRVTFEREPENLEEFALNTIGWELYEAFVYGYTKKQWGCEPRDLPASVLKRLPIRFDYNDNYYNSTFQGIPRNGYTEIVHRILQHPSIEVALGTEWSSSMIEQFDYIIFTGCIDEYFNYTFGRLSYRTVYWEKQVCSGDFQGNAVINYPSDSVSHTRIHEHKHFAPWDTFDKTIVFREFSKETTKNDIPYYPKRLSSDISLLTKYIAHAKKDRKVAFLGRLATYRYMDMHHVIEEALVFSDKWLSCVTRGEKPPTFPRDALQTAYT